MVYEVADGQTALDRPSDLAPDAVVVVGETVALTERRRHVDHAMSIIVVGRNKDAPERLRCGGADSALSAADDLLTRFIAC